MSNSNQARGRRPGAILHLYRDLWGLIRGERRVFIGAVLLLVSAQVTLLAVPYASGRALNALQLRGLDGLRDAGFWLSMALLVAAGSWVLHGPGRILERRTALTIRRRRAALLTDRVFSLPLSWHESHHSASTAHRIQQSTQALSGFAQSQYIYLNSAVRLVGPLIALWCIKPLVGYVAALGLALILSSVIGFDRAMLRLAREENDADRSYTAALVDTLANATTVYALRQARACASRLERRLVAIFAPLRRSILLNEMKWCTVDLSSRALSCILVALFGWLAARPTAGHATLMLGSIYMVWEYAQQAGGVVSQIAAHFQTFARQQADYASANAISDAVSESGLQSSATPEANVHARPPCPPWHRISVHDLTFRHTGTAERPTLHGVRLSLERGKRYALIGASGSGKSTLLRVLGGLYAAERIGLELDGQPARVVPADAARLLRATSTLIPQDAEVYEGTLAENLRLCERLDGNSPHERCAPALQAACVDFVESTPDGLAAPIAERAANWSGGQRGRIALARGILAAGGSPLVLLDEPTASLDPATESQIYTNLFAEFADACLVSSIHRLGLLERFDEVLVMNEGRLVAQGRLEELALNCAEFRRLTAVLRQHDPQTATVNRSNAA
jgi:ABC-type multidrug transport system fused ATPase/permease subunit